MEYSDEIFNELCEKLEHKTIATSEVMVVLDAARMLPDANRRIKQLKAQLPPEMQKCIILLKRVLMDQINEPFEVRVSLGFGESDRMLHKADDKIGCEDCLGDSY